MGALVSSLGFGAGGGTGKAGINFQAESAPIQMPVTTQDAQGLAQQSLNSLQQQQNFTQALQAQNGIGNQSQVFNQLGGVAAGTGPNPAQTMLNQATGANTANQAALMAGQRGAGANTGLIARQAAQQGAHNQQSAVGQGATMQANQSLNALNMQGGIAGQQVGQQATANQAMLSGTQNEQQNLLNAIAAQNNSQVAMQSNKNNANAQLAQQVAAGQQKIAQGLGGSLGGLMGTFGGAALKGVGSLFGGSSPDVTDTTEGIDPSTGAQEGAGEFGPETQASFEDSGALDQMASEGFAEGGEVPESQYNGGTESGTVTGIGTAQGTGGNTGKEEVYQPESAPVDMQSTLATPTISSETAANAPKSKIGQFLHNTAPSGPVADTGIQGKGVIDTGELTAHQKQVAQTYANDARMSADPKTKSSNYEGDWEDTAADVADTAIGIVAGMGTGGIGLVGEGAIKAGESYDTSQNAADEREQTAAGRQEQRAERAQRTNQAHGGKVPAMVSPGEMYLNKKKAQAVAKGKASPMQGERIPGKAKVKGDSLKNDTVPKTLEAGGVVIPRSVMEHPDAAKKAAAFVAAHLAKRGHMPRKPK